MLFFGSLWGINELASGEILFRNDMLFASVWLAAWGFFILAAARSVIHKPGTSTLIAGVAAIFRLVNAPPFFCHLLAIFLLGVGFDMAASWIMKKEKKNSTLRQTAAGFLGAYAGYALFALIITYIVRYQFWTEGGTRKVLHHIFVDGSLAAAASAVLVPLGFRLGSLFRPILSTASLWSPFGASAGVVVLWTLGRLIG